MLREILIFFSVVFWVRKIRVGKGIWEGRGNWGVLMVNVIRVISKVNLIGGNKKNSEMCIVRIYCWLRKVWVVLFLMKKEVVIVFVLVKISKFCGCIDIKMRWNFFVCSLNDKEFNM